MTEKWKRKIKTIEINSEFEFVRAAYQIKNKIRYPTRLSVTVGYDYSMVYCCIRLHKTTFLFSFFFKSIAENRDRHLLQYGEKVYKCEKKKWIIVPTCLFVEPWVWMCLCTSK